MASYEIYPPHGDKVSVTTLGKAVSICADFRNYADHYNGKLQQADSADSDVFKNLDALKSRWDHNVDVIKAMEADTDLALGEKRSAYAALAADISKMAAECSTD